MQCIINNLNAHSTILLEFGTIIRWCSTGLRRSRDYSLCSPLHYGLKWQCIATCQHFLITLTLLCHWGRKSIANFAPFHSCKNYGRDRRIWVNFSRL